MVEDCLDLTKPVDKLFEQAWRSSLAVLPRTQRGGALSPVTGHIAESVAAVFLVDMGYELVWHLTGPGRHGVDLIMLDPSGTTLIAWEVKGTLRQQGWPRLSGRALKQMGAAWINKADNPGMAEWGLRADDLVGGVILVQFQAMRLRFGVTKDYETLLPITSETDLSDLSWVSE